MTLLSIVIPHHDRPEMLASLLQSIPAHQEIEVIVVDDHSESPPDVSQFPHVKFIPQSDGQKYAGAARNTGLSHAQGLWIFFADSDDLFVTDALTDFLSVLETSPAEMIVTNPTSFRDTGEEGSRHKAFSALVAEAIDGHLDALLHFYAPWAKFIRRDLIERHALAFEPVRVSNDVMFSARAHLAAKNIVVQSCTLYRVREGHASLTSRPSPQSIAERLEVLARLNQFLRSSGKSGYQVPAAGQIATLARLSPSLAIKAAVKTRLAGDPVFFTRRHCSKHLRRLFRKRH